MGKWLPNCSRRVVKMRLSSGYYFIMPLRRKFRGSKTRKVPTGVGLLPNSYSVVLLKVGGVIAPLLPPVPTPLIYCIFKKGNSLRSVASVVTSSMGTASAPHFPPRPQPLHIILRASNWFPVPTRECYRAYFNRIFCCTIFHGDFRLSYQPLTLF